MAPKPYPQNDDLPPAAAASSDDGTEEQEDSSDDETEEQDDSSDEEEQHEESNPQKPDPEQDEDESEESDEEEEPVLKKQSVQKYPSPPQSESSEGSGSDSASDGTLNSPTASAFTIKPITSKPMEISPKPKKLASKSTQSKPSAKRPAETDQNGSGSMNKKSKVSNGDGEDGPGKKSALNRLWSEDDEIVILKGMIDYQKEKGSDPYSDMTAFHEFVKDLLSVDVSKSQLTEKIRRLKKKYQNNAEKGENGEDPVFSKPHEHKAFELSKKIWGGGVGINGVDESKVKSSKGKDKKDVKVVNNYVPKLMENTKENVLQDKKDVKVVNNYVPKLMENTKENVLQDKKDVKVVNNYVPKLMENTKEIVLQEAVKDETKEEERMDFWSMYPRLSESLESETSIYLSLPKDAKNFVKERISLLGREKVSQLEEKWKDIRVMECNLYAKRLELIHEQTQMVSHEMKPSKS